MPAQWRYTLHLEDTFYNDALSYEEARNIIVDRIRSSKFYDATDEKLMDVIDGLSEADNVTMFDYYWDDFYDWCDEERVWVKLL